MSDRFIEHLQRQLGQIRQDGLYKSERVIESPQRARIGVAGGRSVLNLCANNYLGLSDDPRIVDAARYPAPQLAAQFFIQRLHDRRDGLPKEKDLARLDRAGLSAENSIDCLQLNMLTGLARAALLGEPGRQKARGIAAQLQLHERPRVGCDARAVELQAANELGSAGRQLVTRG